MPTWTITGLINGAQTTKTFADLKLAQDSAAITLVSQAPDTFEVFQPAGYLDPISFVVDEGEVTALYTIARDGVPWFVGRCKEATPTTDGKMGIQYLFEGPWADLEEVYRQGWSFDGVANFLSKIVFFIDTAGGRVNTAKVLELAVNYGIGLGANMQLGDLSDLQAANILPPQYPATNPTIQEVIKQCLLWSPEVMTWFDYTTTPPTLNFTPRSTAPSLNYVVGAAPTKSVNLTPLYSLVPAGVEIKYVYAGVGETTTDGSEEYIVAVNTAGATTGRKIIRALFELEPGNSNQSFLEQDITTRALPENLADVTTAEWWWQDKTGLYNIDDLLSITVLKGTIPSVGATSLNRELMTGSIQDWMRTTFGAFFVNDYIQADLRYSYTSPLDHKQHKKTERFKVPVTFTNTVLTKFKKNDGASGILPEEPPGVDLAKALYDQLKVLHYEGKIETQAAQCSGLERPGKVVNATAGRPEWATMNAQVQSVRFQIGTGGTSVTVGPAAHLALPDWVSLLKPMRNQWTSGSGSKGPTNPAKADTPKGNAIPGAQATPATGSTPTSSTYSQTHVADPDGDGDNVISLLSRTDDAATAIQITSQNGYAEINVKSGETWVVVFDSDTGAKSTLTPGKLVLVDDDGNTATFSAASLNLSRASGKEVQIDPDDMTGDFASLRQIGVCDAGTARDIDILGGS